MNFTKKQLTYGLMVILIVITTLLVGVFIGNRSVVTQETANSLKSQAIDALEAKNDKMAEDRFKEAKQQYEDLGDANNIVDTEAQLFLLKNK